MQDDGTGRKANIAGYDVVGKTGTASTALRPAGMAEFDGVKLSVVSKGEFIEAGRAVTVECVEGNRIVVHEAKKA